MNKIEKKQVKKRIEELRGEWARLNNQYAQLTVAREETNTQRDKVSTAIAEIEALYNDKTSG